MWFKGLVSVTCVLIVAALAYFVFSDWRREQCLSALRQYVAGAHDSFRNEVMDCTSEGALTEADYDELEAELSGEAD